MRNLIKIGDLFHATSLNFLHYNTNPLAQLLHNPLKVIFPHKHLCSSFEKRRRKQLEGRNLSAVTKAHFDL